MKKVLNKIFAMLNLFVILGIEILPCSVYAANVVNEVVESTGSEIVAFDANINNERSIEANIKDEIGINVNIRSLGEGYLRKVKVKIEDSNYEISRTEEEINKLLIPNEEITNVNRIVQSIDDNDIALKEIDKNEDLKMIIPIRFKQDEKVTKEDIERDSIIKLEATYVNGTEEDLVVEKSVMLHVKWKDEIENEVSQKLLRYIKYDDKTLISFEIANGIKENKMPIDSRAIQIEEPKLNDKLPTVVTVVGKNIEKEENNGTLIIKQTTEQEEGKYSWDSLEKFIVTYIYNEQVESTQVRHVASAKALLISGEVVDGVTGQNEFEVEDKVGDIVEVEQTVPDEINKGYIYTNLNRVEDKLNTEYEVKYRINVGYADITDRIVLEEKSVKMQGYTGGEILDATDSIKTSKIKIQDDIKTILGENGKIVVKNTEGEELGTLDSSNNEISLEARNVLFEITNPEREGNINISVTKEIEGENDFAIDQMTDFRTMKSEINVVGYSKDIEITNESKVGQSLMTEPETKASIDLNTDALSTITGNKDTEFNVTLNKTEISDMLYVNPTIKIRLPDEVKNITLKSAKILYDDELLIERVEQVDKEIIFNLSGVQTKYNTLTTTNGTLLKIVADVELNSLAPSSEAKVVMEYTNDFTRETKIAESNINIIAPKQIITTNQVEIDDKTAFSIDKDVDTLKVKNGQPEKTMQVTGEIINNLGIDVDGVQIIGRMPSAGNKSIGGAELGSNINSTLTAPIEVAGFENAQILYSSNIDEPLDGEGWGEEATADSKSFKIVIPETLNNKSIGGFRYRVSIPADLDYEQVAKENYGVYYNNNSEQGVTQNLAEARVLGIETGRPPEIKVNVSAYDSNEGYEIKEGSTVREGQYITYKVDVVNTGTQDANDVNVKVTLPDGLDLIEESRGIDTVRYSTVKSEIREIEKSFDTLKGNDKIDFTFNTQVNKVFLEKSKEEENEEQEKERYDYNKIELLIETKSDIIDESLITKFATNNTKGNLAILLTSDAGEYLEPKQIINYRVKVDNVSYEEKNNTRILLHLPEGIRFKDIKGYNANYNEFNKSVEIIIDDLDYKQSSIIEIECENVSEKQEELLVYASAYYDELIGEIKSNYEKYINNVTTKSISATQSVNTTVGITDKDTIEFYINIENISNLQQVVEFEDTISTQLEIEEFTISMEGDTVRRGSTNYISELISIPANTTVKVFVKAKSLPIVKGEFIQIDNKPRIVTENGDEIDVEMISISIEGTKEEEKEEIIENQEEINVTNENREFYKISGSIWYDENRNGEKDITEQRILGSKVTLVDAKTNKTVLNDDGSELSSITNNNGEYIFNKLKPGNYIVQAEYDTKNYEITQYKADGVEESINSDFVKYATRDNSIAVTDVIKVTDDSIINIDLGLVKREQLSINVTQSISKITVINSKKDTREISSNDTKVKLELSKNELKDSTVLVEYNVKVTNYGDIPGFAKQIVEYVPEGMKFVSEINPDWYMGKDGYLYTVAMSNEMINQGDSKEIKLVLMKKINENGLGVIRGKAELNTVYSETALAEIRAQSSRFINSESDLSTSDLIIVKKINVKTISIIGITIGILGLLTLASYEVKKNIINKLYNMDEM